MKRPYIELVTAVIPTYNRAHLIADALDSVAVQTHRPIEIIVVDDGSTDNTDDVVAQWKSANEVANKVSIRYVRQKNQGGNVARNRGINEASGGVVAFLDSDDLWHASKLEKQLAVFMDAPDIGAVYSGLQLVDLKSGQITETSKRAYPQGRILEQMLIHDVTSPTSTYMVRRNVFESVGYFDVDLQARQDWDMWIRVAASYKIGCVPEPLVDFRDHDGPRTASNPQKEINAYHRIMAKYADLRSHCSLPVRQAAKASFYRRMGRVYFHHKQENIKALSFYLKSIVVWPFVFDSYAALAGLFLPRSLRGQIHRIWNRLLGKTCLAIKSH